MTIFCPAKRDQSNPHFLANGIFVCAPSLNYSKISNGRLNRSYAQFKLLFGLDRQKNNPEHQRSYFYGIMELSYQLAIVV